MERRFLLMCITRIVVLIFGIYFVFSAAGCSTLARKFKRKAKKKEVKEEVVLEPQEYEDPLMTASELYQQYFLFWRSWHDELIDSLSEEEANKKRQLSCAYEVIKNLESLRDLLKDEKQKQLQKYINDVQALKSAIEKDIYQDEVSWHKRAAARLKKKIMREYSYSRIKEMLL